MQLSTAHRPNAARFLEIREASSFVYVAAVTPKGRGTAPVSPIGDAKRLGYRFAIDPLGNVRAATVDVDRKDVIEDGHAVEVDGEPLELDVGVTIAAFSSQRAAKQWLRSLPQAA